MKNIYDFIIIGGGPAGIGAAVEASIMGYTNVLMIEKADNHSQTIRKFYRENKRVDKIYHGHNVEFEGNVKFMDGSKESTLDYFDMLLDRESIEVLFNTEVENIEKTDEIFKVSVSNEYFLTKNIIVAIGRMGKPNKPDYKIPASINDRVNFNLTKCSQGENILVVGGGNSAVEYATSLSQTNNVILNYRKSSFTRLNDINFKAIHEFEKDEKLKLLLGKDVVSLENESGNIAVIFNDESKMNFDRIIYAIGGTTPVDFLQKCGIKTDERKLPFFDENYETNIKNMFICGDIVTTSGASIAVALSQSFQIIDYLNKRDK